MRPLLLTLAVICLAFAGCTQGKAEKIYDIKGKVVSIDVAKKSVKLDHEDIPRFMKAM